MHPSTGRLARRDLHALYHTSRSLSSLPFGGKQKEKGSIPPALASVGEILLVLRVVAGRGSLEFSSFSHQQNDGQTSL